MNKKNIIVISGPSGSGKSSLIKKLFKKNKLNFSISHTTRAIRGQEENGIDYYFVSNNNFKTMIEQNEFAEWAKVYLNYYGTSWEEIKDKSDKDDILILDIDIQGAKKIKEKFNEAVLILISPPSLSVLEKRLINREKRNDNDIKTRLKNALSELEEFHIYDYIIINDDLEESFEKLDTIFSAFKNRTQFISNELLEITKNWNN